MAEINIKQLLERAFHVAPKYLIPQRGGMDKVDSPNYQGIAVWDEGVAFDVSPLGTPILELIHFHSGSYQSFEIEDGIPVPKKINYPSYHFDLWPMVDISQDKVIVTTPITGRDGTVKEYIYTDDHQVTIRGVLVGEGNSYPHDAKREMVNMFKVNDTYGVTSRILNDQGIFALVVKSLQFTDLEGYNNVCPFTIQAISDRDVLLTIKDKRKI